jgi:hypothetical protein
MMHPFQKRSISLLPSKSLRPTISIFCGASSGNSPVHIKTARALAVALHNNNNDKLVEIMTRERERDRKRKEMNLWKGRGLRKGQGRLWLLPRSLNCFVRDLVMPINPTVTAQAQGAFTVVEQVV